MTRPNIPVPDELADTRAKIKALEQREAELKQILLANPDVREGANWLAEIKTVTQNRTDLKELRAAHPNLVAEYTFPVKVTSIVLSGISEDGEIVSARKFHQATESHPT
jgi:predicted phage-related endonuclease